MAVIIDGKKRAEIIKDEIKQEVENFNKKYKRTPSLAVILVGGDKASKIYVNNKIKASAYCGIKSLSYELRDTATEDEVHELIQQLNADNNIDGILLQLPLPKGLDGEKLISAIDTSKDVDGISINNLGNLLANGSSRLSACTPLGCIDLIKQQNIKIEGKHAVVIGRSNIVGKPISVMLLNENATVTMCHSKTANLAEITKQADILVVSIGKANFVTADMVKKDAVVIDVGINRTDSGLAGDVDFNAVKDIASYITPVPGGVGPMTIAMLMQNTLKAAKYRAEDNG